LRWNYQEARFLLREGLHTFRLKRDGTNSRGKDMDIILKIMWAYHLHKQRLMIMYDIMTQAFSVLPSVF